MSDIGLRPDNWNASLCGKKVVDARETGEASIIYSDPTFWCWKLILLLKNFK